MDERPPTPADVEDRLLPWSQVKVISGLSRTTVWRLQKTGDFPTPVQVSRNRVGWSQNELLEWKRTRLPRRLPDPASSLTAARQVSRSSIAKPVARPQLPGPEPVPSKPPRALRKRRTPTSGSHQGSFDFG